MTRNLEGKTALITGATSGIGLHTAVGLAKQGAEVYVTGRDRQRGEEGVRQIKAASGSSRVELILADISSLAGVRSLAETFQVRATGLHILINNVGGLYRECWQTPDRLEASFAVNHLVPFLLTRQLLDTLKVSAPARIVNVTGGMPGARIDLDNLQAEKGYAGLITYSRAKRVMECASYEWAEKLAGTGVTLNVAFPGPADTNMTAAMKPDMVPTTLRLAWPLFRLVMRKSRPERASHSSVFAASSPTLDGVSGKYLDANSKFRDWASDVVDERNRKAIWQRSEALIQSYS